MKKNMIILITVMCLCSCKQEQPQIIETPVEPTKRYRVIQDGKLAGVDLELVYDQISSATFRTRDGRKVVYHGTFYYEEAPWK